MNITGLIILIVTGGVVGWLAGSFIKDWSIGILGNIFIGIIGGVVGGLMYRLLVIRQPPSSEVISDYKAENELMISVLSLKTQQMRCTCNSINLR